MKINKYQTAILLGIIAILPMDWLGIQGFNLLGDKYTPDNFPRSGT